MQQPNYETVELQNQHNVLLEELESGSSELSSLDSELELLNLAAGMLLLDEKQPGGLYQQVAVKRCNIMDLKKQWYLSTIFYIIFKLKESMHNLKCICTVMIVCVFFQGRYKADFGS